MGKINVFMRKKNSIAHKKWLKSINKKNASIMSNYFVKTSAAYKEAYVQHKLKRWELTHPKPWKWEGTQQDLFDREYFIPWKDAREKELERIRNFVNSVYDKFVIIGRYNVGQEKYIERRIGVIKQRKLLSNYNSLNDVPLSRKKIDKFICKKAISMSHNMNERLVCCIVSDEYRRIGRLVLPAA